MIFLIFKSKDNKTSTLKLKSSRVQISGSVGFLGCEDRFEGFKVNLVQSVHGKQTSIRFSFLL